jgi:hypothetical protein
MDNARPSLDLKHLANICPDRNGMSKTQLYELGLTSANFQVPVIAIFTKFDQFKRDVRMKMDDEGRDPGTNLNEEVEGRFREHYQAGLGGSPLFVRLESKDSSLSTNVYRANHCPAGMDKPGQKCTALIEMTADALSRNVVSLILVAVQRNNLELSINQALTK